MNILCQVFGEDNTHSEFSVNTIKCPHYSKTKICITSEINQCDSNYFNHLTDQTHTYKLWHMFIYVDNGDMTTQRHSNNTNYCTIINNSCWLDWPDILTKPLPSALSKRFHRSWERVFYGSAPFAWQKAFQFGRLITLHFTPQCYARAICAVVVCLSVRHKPAL